MKRHILTCGLVVSLLFGAAAWATVVYYVDASAQGANNGTSWTDAFTTIQGAVNAAYNAGGGEAWVKTGTYTGFPGDGVTDRASSPHPAPSRLLIRRTRVSL